MEHGSSKNLQRLVSELKGEKMALNLALENSKANESKIVLENNRLKMIIEVNYFCLRYFINISIVYLL